MDLAISNINLLGLNIQQMADDLGTTSDFIMKALPARAITREVEASCIEYIKNLDAVDKLLDAAQKAPSQSVQKVAFQRCFALAKTVEELQQLWHELPVYGFEQLREQIRAHAKWVDMGEFQDKDVLRKAIEGAKAPESLRALWEAFPSAREYDDLRDRLSKRWVQLCEDERAGAKLSATRLVTLYRAAPTGSEIQKMLFGDVATLYVQEEMSLPA